MRLREELFGPVAVLYRVSSAEQAVEMANDSPFGLGAAVFGRDEIKARDVADQLEVGMVGINTTIKSAPDMPSVASRVRESAGSSEDSGSMSSRTRSSSES